MRDNPGAYEGGAYDLGFFDQSPNYNPRSTYYHERMLAEKAKKNFLWGYTNDNKLKQVSTGDETGYAIMVMNDNNYGANYTIRLNYDIQTNTFIVYVDAGVAKQYQSYIGAQETQMVFFDSSGNYVGKITYDSDNEAAGHGPVYSGSTPDRSGARIATDVQEGNFAIASFEVFPNPVVDNELYVKGAEGKKVSLYDVAGKFVRQSSSSILDVRDLGRGMYIVKVGNETKRVLID